MAGLFSRVKTWLKLETIKAADLNAEFDNVITNFIPTKIDDYSSSVSQMRTETSPGVQGAESQATSLAGEIERIRYAVRRAIGGTYWYDNPNISLSSIASTLSSGLIIPRNRIDSGRVDVNNQPMFLKAPASGLTLTLDCTPTPLRVYIDNNLIEQEDDLTISLSSPSSCTLAVNDTSLTAQESSKQKGENETSIAVTSSGTPPTAGTYQAWKITHGGNTEYFLARYVSTTLLDKAKRGWFFDKDGLWIPRIAIAYNDPITLCRIGYIFYVNTAGVGTLNVTYNRPSISYDTPSGASVGDYWFDLNSGVWKIYNGVDFSANTSIFVGVAVVDGSNIVATRSVDFGKSYSDLNTMDAEKTDSGNIKTARLGAKVNVYGNGFDFNETHVTWSMSTDRDSGVSDSANGIYYLYLTDKGDPVISDVIPHDRRDTLLGYYHPAKPWRCLFKTENDGSSNLVDRYPVKIEKTSYPYNSGYVKSVSASELIDLSCDELLCDTSGGDITLTLPSCVGVAGKKITLKKIHNSNKVTIATTGGQTIEGALNEYLYGIYATITLFSSGTEWLILDLHDRKTFTPTLSVAAGGGSTSNAAGTWYRTLKLRHIFTSFDYTGMAGAIIVRFSPSNIPDGGPSSSLYSGCGRRPNGSGTSGTVGLFSGNMDCSVTAAEAGASGSLGFFLNYE